MQKNKMIAPSTERAKNVFEIKKLENDIMADADFLHVDIMDGKFVERMLLSFDEIVQISNSSKMKLDFHLMCDFVSNKENLDFYISQKPHNISIHLEAFESQEEILKAINKIKTAGIKVGLAIKLETDIEKVFEFLQFVDMVLIMSVKVGWGGQKFEEVSFEKIKKLKQEIEKQNLDVLVEVDGGINDTNAKDLFEIGADILVCGSFVFNALNRSQTILNLKN